MGQPEPPSSISHSRSHFFFIGKDGSGNWVVQDGQHLCGGLFIDRAAALRFAMFENGNRPQAVVMVPGIFELDLCAKSSVPVQATVRTNAPLPRRVGQKILSFLPNPTAIPVEGRTRPNPSPISSEEQIVDAISKLRAPCAPIAVTVVWERVNTTDRRYHGGNEDRYRANFLQRGRRVLARLAAALSPARSASWGGPVAGTPLAAKMTEMTASVTVAEAMRASRLRAINCSAFRRDRSA